MKKNKKMIISIILLLVFIIPIFSGCLLMETFPVETIIPRVNWDYSNVKLTGKIGVPFCKAKNHTLVYDNVSHENWSDYAIKLYIDHVPSGDKFFYGILSFLDLKSGVTYYTRSVAFCYDFEKPFLNYEEGYYQGDEKTFIV
jgi:hypothetical protein